MAPNKLPKCGFPELWIPVNILAIFLFFYKPIIPS
jgi:hypothetical protein